MDHKKYTGLISLPSEFGEFYKMFPSPEGYGIGEHGDLFPEQGTGFDFKDELLLPFLKEKIKPAPSKGDLCLENLESLQSRDLLLFNEMVCHMVGQMSVQEDGVPLFFNGHNGILCFSLRGAGMFLKKESAVREEKLSELARIGKMGPDAPPFYRTFGHEPVRPVKKGGNRYIPKKIKQNKVNPVNIYVKCVPSEGVPTSCLLYWSGYCIY